MIDIKQRPEVGWNFLLAISLAGILVASWFAFIQPKPKATLPTDPQIALRGIQSATKEADSKASEVQDSIDARTWDVSAEVLGSQMQDVLTHLCEKNHCILAGFRPGRAITAASLVEVPFIVVIEGGFLELMSILRDLEKPEAKIAVSQVQVASNSATDQVRATVSLTAFIKGEGK